MIIYRGQEHGFRICPHCGTVEIWHNINDKGEFVSHSVNCKCKALPELENYSPFRLQIEWNKAAQAEEEKMIKEDSANPPQPVSEADLKAMYDAYTDDNATE